MSKKVLIGIAFVASGCASMGSSASLKPVHFKYDDSALTEEAREVLSKNSTVLKKQSSGRIIVEGHTDERGTNEYNIALGERRAKATRDYLVAKGVSADRLMTKSWGEEKPAETGQTEKAYAKNRRAEFIVDSDSHGSNKLK